MKYEVKYDPKALKQLDKLPWNIAQRIVKKIGEVSETGRGIITSNIFNKDIVSFHF